MNRALSIRSNKSASGGPSSGGAGGTRKGFSFSSLRGHYQPELSRRLYKLIKSENNLVSAHEAAHRERVAIATQLSEWGEQTGDEAISDVSDKVGVVLSEVGEQEDAYAHALDDSRALLKQIRNTEKSVQPSRDGKNKIADEIARLKSKEPESARLPVLEQEFVRAEAENLVAEAQLTNITRQKLKEAYEAEFIATIERAEKQIILARHGRRLLELLDDSPITPGDPRPLYTGGAQARQILNDAEDDIRDWQLDLGGGSHGTRTDQAQAQTQTTTTTPPPHVRSPTAEEEPTSPQAAAGAASRAGKGGREDQDPDLDPSTPANTQGENGRRGGGGMPGAFTEDAQSLRQLDGSGSGSGSGAFLGASPGSLAAGLKYEEMLTPRQSSLAFL